jgi:hypothetical protein
LQPELNQLSKQGRWQAMGERISEEMLHTFAVVGEPADIVPELQRRFGGLVDRLTLDFAFVAPEERPALIRALAG